MISADSIKVADSLRYVTPKGKVVYGGGGIIPDVFIPKDTSLEYETLDYITRNGFVSYFIFEYLEQHRSEFDGMTKEEFVTDFEVKEELNNEFLEYSRLNETESHFEEYQDQIKRILKASIAQQLYGSNTYEAILNEEDAMIKKVLELVAVSK